MIPPFVTVLKEVTDEEQYETRIMAMLDYKMPEKDKQEIEETLRQSRKNTE
jgi:CheY-like chemotaxis protein